MRVLLLSLPLMDRFYNRLIPIAMDAKRTSPPYGIYLLAAVLNANGYQTDIADLIAEGTNDISQLIPNINQYDLIGLGATSFSWPTVKQCIHEIREINTDVPIVLGGIHPTMFDHYILCTTGANFVIRGEGEIAIVELCEALLGLRKFSEVTNLTYKDTENKIIQNGIFHTVDLSSLPIPDYSLLPDQAYSGLSIESSRGCPFDCVFCSTNYRKTYRALDPIEFVNRLEAILPFVKNTKQKTIHIIDDEFSLNTKRVKSIIDEIIKRGLSPNFVFDSRVNDINDEEMVEKIAPYTGKFLIGAECGYDEGLSKVGKKTTVEKIEKAASNLQKYGIAHLSDFSFIIGFPWESYEDVLRTIKFSSTLLVKYGINVLLQWYLQIPGSRLWNEQAERGIVCEALYDDYGLFRDVYLFRTGINFTLDEFNEITNIVKSIRLVHSMNSKENPCLLEYGHPHPIKIGFPNKCMENQHSSGLHNLRELSQEIRR